ncbi:MAG TPA: inner membrane protein YhjD [Mycobacterium sp.]|nr:inner membrane protein YhjD [Mycobacterium sp.]
MTEENHPGVIDRLRARYGWLDHVLRANERYDESSGNFFAAALSYYTIFALFPLLMVGFSVGGLLLSRRPDVLEQIEHRVRTTIPGESGKQLVTLIDSAIASRTSIGIIGLAVAGWVGLNWMDKLRDALSAMWDQRSEKAGFVRTKLSDSVALVSAFVASVITIGLTALGDSKPMAKVLGWLGVPDFALLGALLRAASLVMSVLVSWLLFTWMIARLPREPVSFAGSIRAGLIAAIGFEVFKQVGSIYLRSVVNGPAGATFGPVLGVMVFAYITARLVLFATAWAATASPAARPPPPAPAG